MLFLGVLVILALWSSCINEKETTAYRGAVLQSLEEIKYNQLAPVRAKEKADAEAKFISWYEDVMDGIRGSGGVLMQDFLDSEPEDFREEFERGLTSEQTVNEIHWDMYGPSEEEKAAMRQPRVICITPKSFRSLSEQKQRRVEMAALCWK